MICPACEAAIIYINVARTTQAYIYYEDIVKVNIVTQETTDLIKNSDEDVGDTVDQWVHYYCPHCLAILDEFIFDHYPYLTMYEQEYFEEE